MLHAETQLYQGILDCLELYERRLRARFLGVDDDVDSPRFLI